MAEPAIPGADVTATLLEQVVQALVDAPETINPGTQLYYKLYLDYTFGNLDIGQLLLSQDAITETIEAGQAEQAAVKAMHDRLKALPSRSSRYVTL